MNDYRNFQSKTRRRKGSNFNKHCKGKQALKQKNNYNIVFSNKHKQIAQSKHAQQYHKFVNKTRSKEIKDVDHGLFHYKSPLPKHETNCYQRWPWLLLPRQLQQEFKQDVQQKIIHLLDKECLYPPTDDPSANTSTETMRLYCLDRTFYFWDKYFSCGDAKDNEQENETNGKESMDENENILTRIPCDVFFYCICNKYLYPNEIFLLLSVSKKIYAILTNNNNSNNNHNSNGYSFLHSLISNQRLIAYLLKVIDSLNDIASNGPELSQKEDEDNNLVYPGLMWLEREERRWNIERVERFHIQVKKMQSICVSIISWLDNKSADNCDCKGRKKLVIKHRKLVDYEWTGDNPSPDTYTVTCQELAKIDDLNESLKKVMQRLQYLFILAVSILAVPLNNDKNNNNNNNKKQNDKNVEIFCDSQVVDVFCKNIATVKVINHLNKRCTNAKSKMILKSNVEFIQMSDCLRLYFDDKNIMNTSKLHQEDYNYNYNTSIVKNNEILCIYTWGKYKRFLKKSSRYPQKPDAFYRFNIIFDQIDDYKDWRYPKYRRFKWISSLADSNMCNALFLVVCVKHKNQR